MKVTIVPEDNYIQVDGVGLNFPFEASEKVHAIQWYDDHGVVEQKQGGTRETTIEEVQHFVSLWQNEKYRLDNLPAPVDNTPPREKAKKIRTKLVSDILVTTQTGKVFDGDEVAQGRIARAILSLEPLEETIWVLANNVPTMVSREELQEALRLAGIAQTQVWTTPYEV
jgi:hypothetical protein